MENKKPCPWPLPGRKCNHGSTKRESVNCWVQISHGKRIQNNVCRVEQGEVVRRFKRRSKMKTPVENNKKETLQDWSELIGHKPKNQSERIQTRIITTGIGFTKILVFGYGNEIFMGMFSKHASSSFSMLYSTSAVGTVNLEQKANYTVITACCPMNPPALGDISLTHLERYLTVIFCNAENT